MRPKIENKGTTFNNQLILFTFLFRQISYTCPEHPADKPLRPEGFRLQLNI